MAGNASDSGSGFSDHVMGQLQQAAHQVTNPQQGRGRGRGRSGRGQGRGRTLPTKALPPPEPVATHSSKTPPGLDAFPLLRSPRIDAPPAGPVAASATQQTTRQPQPRGPTHQRQVAPREFFDRARGDYRGPQGASRSHHHPNQQVSQMYMQSHDDFRRPPAPRGSLYQHNASPVINNWNGYASPGHDLRLQVITQSDYLNDLQFQARAKYQLKLEETQMKEDFRKKLETFFQETLCVNYPEIIASEVRLKCYGSLNNGFGLADCDMDLLLALPKGFTLKGRIPDSGKATTKHDPEAPVPTQHEGNVAAIQAERTSEKFDLGWLLEDALLDADIGARLLTNTRVPIMKVCEKPGDELLQKMRQYSRESRKPPSPRLPAREISLARYPPILDMVAIELALSDLEASDSAAQVFIPDGPEKINGAGVEFSGDHGIKCDINFSNFVALCNTRLLKEYCAYDHRVAEVGVFVKTWAKLRDINTPYWGTLSSYGYVLMVLHYLMNVVSPPVIPNLQYLAQEEDAWKDPTEIELFEGKYDTRFWMDKGKIASFRSTAPRNRESTGHLIRGFFWYYSAREGFNYKFDTISIRSQGGIIKKQEKGWTEAKWASDNKNVRQRYLFAIEDPFETEHNVARVVGHNGIVAIRDEFRRAWDMISRIGTSTAINGSLLESVEGRGDLLRKDQEHHRQKMRQMRQEAEAKERAIHKTLVQGNGDVQETGMFDEYDPSSSLPSTIRSNHRWLSNTLLTRDVGTFQDKPRQSKHGRYRAVKDDSEDESNAGNEADDKRAENVVVGSSRGTGAKDLNGAWDEQQDIFLRAKEEGPEPFCDPAEILMKNGLDVNGNLVAWDLSTQDGRWLHWRDTKIRKRSWKGVAHQPGWAKLDKMCPFDSHRPRPENVQEHKDAHELMYVWHPPIPLNNPERITSTEKALSAAIPKPYLASNQFRKPVPAQHLPSQPESIDHDGPIGLPILWDKRTRGGRWLIERDTKVRLGTFTKPKPNSMYRKLDRRFPHDATMSRQQLDRHNEELRRHYRSTIRPSTALYDDPRKRNKTNSSQQLNDDAESFVTNPFETGEAVESFTQPTGSEVKRLSCETPKSFLPDSAKSGSTIIYDDVNDSKTQDEKDSALSGEMPESSFIRSRRLAFFAQQEQGSSCVKADMTVPDADNIQGLMKEAGIDVGKPEFAHEDSAISGTSMPSNANGTLHLGEEFRKQWPYGKRPWTRRARSRRMPQTDGPMSLTNSSDKHVSEHFDIALRSPQPSEVASEQHVSDGTTEFFEAHEFHVPQVPDTLFPDLDNDERPRDEDPNIMPIPRHYGFEFDTRQLHDLAVIKEGGNACARDGFQFEIEQDYELGGSGEMAWRQSSGKRFSSDPHDDEMYDYGKGDEEGLLGELPDL